MLSIVDPNSRLLTYAALGVVISALIFARGLLIGTHSALMAGRLAAAVGLAYGAFFVPPLFQCALFVSSSILIISTLRHLTWDSVDDQSQASPTLKTVVPILVIILPVAGLLLYRLGSFSPTLLTWEGTTMNALILELQQNIPVWQIVKRHLLWRDGILSAGETSLLFGVPSLLLSREFGPSISLLRGISVFWMLAATVTFALIFRRGFGLLAPCVAVLVFGLNEVILIYGRYGSSISGTMFALALATFFAVRVAERANLLCATLFGLSLYVATLGYAAARISVLILLMAVAFLIPSISCSQRRKWGVFLIITGAAGAVWLFQKGHNHHNAFLRARGEQIFYMGSQRQLLFTSEVLAKRADPTIPLVWTERLAIARELIQKATGPQLWNILSPYSQERRSRFPFKDDPPFLKIFAPALFPWMMIGFVAVWRRGRRHIGTICVSLVGLGIIPLLLTNRVDSYRAIFLTIPLSIWITVGIAEFIHAIERVRISKALIFCGLAAGFACGFVPRLHDLYTSPTSPSVQESDLYDAMKRVPGPLTVILNLDHKLESAIGIELFKRFKNKGVGSKLLQDSLADSLTNERVDSNLSAFQQAVSLLSSGEVLILAPASRYKITAGKLRQLGYAVRTSGAPRFSVFAISKPEIDVDLENANERLLPPPKALEPLHQPHVFNHHTAIDLTSLAPLHTHYDFAPPKKDSTFSGSPPGWRNLRFTHFMGTHATTTLEYAVPAGAEGFQSWIGISPGVGLCTRSSAQVIVRDQNDTVMYTSPLLVENNDPIFFSIALNSASRLRIHILDAGDSRDCDHVDFGDPAFMVLKADPPTK